MQKTICEILRQFGSFLTADAVICAGGLTVFGVWLIRTSLGRKALVDSAPRGNNMPLYTPFIPLFIWLGSVSAASLITVELLPELGDWQSALLDQIILCIGAIAAIAVTIFLAKRTFAEELKGFGLNLKTIHKDFFVAAINLFSVWPLVLLTVILTMHVGQLIWGPDYNLQQHEELKLIKEYSQLPVRILIIVTAATIAPVFEEMLFRGLFQTIIRTFLTRRQRFRIEADPILQAEVEMERPAQSEQVSAGTSNMAWPAILISSVLFAMVHSNFGHWPALFVLAVCLGYSYEKSGSLLRPIFIHSFFNTASILATLYSA
jgi:membrane protease YdiL (CAAX protease family)